jgi:SagB-type dehydrogenase family enzyme
LVPGLYIYSAAADRLDLIRAGDQRVIAAALSLQQELAGNACVAISMVANLKQLTAEHGPRGYRYAHFEAGAIGQRMYVAAESLGLRATGMGAFFDDEVSRYLNLSPAEGEVVYHFAIGYPVHDARLDALA